MVKNSKVIAVFALLSFFIPLTALSAESGDDVRTGGIYDALAVTYDSNPRLKAQRKALQSLDERVAQAVSGWRPSASIYYQKGRQRTSFERAGWSYSDKKLRQISISQPIFNGGQTWSAMKAAKALVMAGRAELLGREQEILLDAVAAYMDVVQAQLILDLNRKNVDVLKQQLTSAKQRFDVGEVTRTDVAQSEARLAQARSNLTEAEGDLESARAAYRRVVGVEAGTQEISMPEQLPDVPQSLDETIEIAMNESPRVAAAKYREVAADYDVNSQIGALLPQLSIDALMRRDEGTGISGASQFDTDSVLFNLTIPLYQSGAQHSRVREYKNIREQRKYEYKDAEYETRQNAIQAWENLQTYRATLLSNQSAVDAARVALNGVKQEHKYGRRTTLDVLDAERELFRTQVNMVRSQRNQVVALFNLLGVLGRLDAENLKLQVELYDPDEHYDDVKYRFIGF